MSASNNQKRQIRVKNNLRPRTVTENTGRAVRQADWGFILIIVVMMGAAAAWVWVLIFSLMAGQLRRML